MMEYLCVWITYADHSDGTDRHGEYDGMPVCIDHDQSDGSDRHGEFESMNSIPVGMNHDQSDGTDHHGEYDVLRHIEAPALKLN